MTSSRDDAAADWVPDTAAGVLALARQRRAVADRAEADLLVLAVGWAVMHPAGSIEEAETIRLRSFGDTDIPVAGPGAPLVREFSVAEFGAAVGLGTEAGKRYLGQAVEIRYRLPRLWKRLTSGELAGWRARRVADRTTDLSLEAAGYVDRQVAGVAHKVSPGQVDRLVSEAIVRFMPALAEERRRAAWDQTHVSIDQHGVGIAGTCQVTGELDLADALDLEEAVRAEADRIADLGNPHTRDQTRDQRRARALGNIARRDLTLDYPPTSTGAGGGDPDPAPQPTGGAGGGTGTGGGAGSAGRRKVVLYLHLSQTAVTGTGQGDPGQGDPGQGGHGGEVGRVENAGAPVTAQTIRDWCGRPDLQVTVKPVLDLAEHVSVAAYEVPDRVAEPVALRDISCVFPWCTRPARKLHPDQHPCDQDHTVPFDAGGPTCVCQVAALCRRHHRLKTHGGWSYYLLEPGSYVWTSPHRYRYLRDHTGTLDISPDQHHRRAHHATPGEPSADHPPAET